MPLLHRASSRGTGTCTHGAGLGIFTADAGDGVPMEMARSTDEPCPQLLTLCLS